MLEISDKKDLESRGIVLCSENKGTNDQLCGYHTADLGLCFCICKKQVSHNPAQYHIGLVVRNPVFRVSDQGPSQFGLYSHRRWLEG